MLQVFVPGAGRDNPEVLRSVGLGDMILDANSFAIGEGPSGEPGTLWFWPKPGRPQFGYNANQSWVKAAARDNLPAGRYWVQTDGDLSPVELRRPYQERGVWRTLGDGEQWLFPSAAELPRDLILEDDGSIRFELQRKFSDFGIEADRWKERCVKGADGDGGEFSFVDMVRFAVDALRINYRLTPEIASAKRLFSTANIVPAVFAAVGIQSNAGA